MLSVLSPLTFEECRTNPKEWGRWVESAVGVHLLNQSLEQDFKLYYWRERNEEVDFVMEHRGKIVAIEVKSGAEKAMPGLKKFKDKYPSTKLYATGSSGIPLETFLNLNPMELF
jgi:predicted AAA+ superfamily ATPase